MGDTTDELIGLAHEVSPHPDPRELDMLVSVGERISCALAAMAIMDLGHDAISLTGSQAGIVTDTSHGKAKIVEVRAQADPRGARRGQDRARRRLPGRLDRVARRHDARPRRLRHDRGRARGRARRRRLRDLHRRRRASSPPTRASSRTRGSSTRSATRRCSRWPLRARGSCSYARSSSRAATTSGSTSARRSADAEGTWITRGG